jgi:hypothetical protein
LSDSKRTIKKYKKKSQIQKKIFFFFDPANKNTQSDDKMDGICLQLFKITVINTTKEEEEEKVSFSK